MTAHLEVRGQLAWLTLDRPQALNALTFSTIREIGERIDDAARSDARALVITGAGEKAFCAGADIKELVGRGMEAEREGALLGQRTFAKLDTLRMPSIALVNGYCFGGGAELALACTFRLATANAKFGLPEIKLGLIPGYGGTQRLPRLIGEAHALELILTGRTVSAEEAQRIGLVNQLLSGSPIEETAAFAAAFTGHGMLAANFVRDAVRRGLGTTLNHGLEIEADLSTLAYQSQDAAEGMMAFVEKRPAKFQDR
jgi:enoyl-CoA hydratase